MAAPKRQRSCSQSLEPVSPPKISRSQASSPSRQQILFLIMADTHGAELPITIPECDVLLHCGDITNDGSPTSIAKALDALGRIKAELKLVIAGNHEISLDAEYYLSEGGRAADVNQARDLISAKPTSAASKSGIKFLSEGTHTFTLASGATFNIYTSPHTPAHGVSAFQYPSHEDRFNLPGATPPWARSTGTEASIIPPSIDIIMTHGPPKYILDSTADGRSAGCEHLRRALERVKPALHCFGHVHTSYGAQRLEYTADFKSKDHSDTITPLAKEWVGRNQAKKKGFASIPPGSLEGFRKGVQTLCINAAMECDEDGQVVNAPWLVELDLPLRTGIDV